MKRRSILEEFELAGRYLVQWTSFAASLVALGFRELRTSEVGAAFGTASQILARKLDEGWREDAFVLFPLAAITALGFFIFGGFEAPSAAFDEERAPRPEYVASFGIPELLKPVSSSMGPLRYEPADSVGAPKALPPKPATVDRIETPIPKEKLIPTSPAFITLFGEGAYEGWYRSDYKIGKGHHVGSDFAEDHSKSTSEGLTLTIEDRTAGDGAPWVTGEISTHKIYGYGRYEVVMKPARGEGLVSSFFTYTGPYFKTPHDEIDIEFLGKNPRQVEVNTFQNGQPRYGALIELPFDATEAFHLYAFEWTPDGVTWFIDGVEVHSTPKGAAHIPRVSGKIMMNLWTGDFAEAWHGPAKFKSGVQAEYACVSYRSIGEKARSCSDFFDFSARMRLLLASN